MVTRAYISWGIICTLGVLWTHRGILLALINVFAFMAVSGKTVLTRAGVGTVGIFTISVIVTWVVITLINIHAVSAFFLSYVSRRAWIQFVTFGEPISMVTVFADAGVAWLLLYTFSVHVTQMHVTIALRDVNAVSIFIKLVSLVTGALPHSILVVAATEVHTGTWTLLVVTDWMVFALTGTFLATVLCVPSFINLVCHVVVCTGVVTLADWDTGGAVQNEAWHALTSITSVVLTRVFINHSIHACLWASGGVWVVLHVTVAGIGAVQD